MRMIRVVILCVVLALALTTASFADNVFKQPRRPHAVLYQVKPDATAAELGALNGILHSRSVRREKSIGNLGIHLDFYADTSVSEEELCEELMATRAVKYAEPDYLITPVVIPDDPYYGSQWQLPKIGASEAWDTTTGSYSTLVAVCDTGISSGHPDLADNLQLPGYNAVDGSTDTEPVYNHGTGVAGCIGATGNNALGVTGVAWDVAILPIRITNTSDGLAYISDAADGIRYAADQGAKVVNLSYRMAGYSTIDSAAQYLRGKGGLLFVAAGNDGQDPGWPDFSSFIAVGATTSSDTKASWSNYGTYIDIVAPGSGIYSTSGSSGYASMSGTSFSSPIAAGVAALLYSLNSTFTPEQVESFIFGSGVDLGDPGDDAIFGHGLIDAAAAVALALGSSQNVNPVSVPSATPISGTAPLTVSFDGSLSYDSDGEILSYSWDFGDGASGSGSVIDHTYTSAGTYTASLTVTDNNGASASDTVQILVEPDPGKIVYVENIAMSLSTVPGGTVAEATVTIIDLDGNLCPGAVVTGTWSGPKSSTAIGTTDSAGTVTLASLKTKGTFTYTFTVTDVSAPGYAYDPSLNIEISDWISNGDSQNAPPVAAATADPVSGAPPLTVTFDGSGSYDTDGQIVSYAWDFGDGSTGSGVYVDHIYEASGTYTATLTVLDDQGAGDSTGMTITVLSDPSKVIYVSSMDLILVPVPGGTMAEATVKVVDINGSPRPGATVTGEWNGIVSGTAQGITGSDGSIVFDSKKTKKTGTITFTVTSVSLSGYAYDPSLNIETSISVSMTP